MPDLETTTPDYTKDEVESLPTKAGSNSDKSKTAEKAAVSGVSKALSGMNKDASDNKAKTQNIADKAVSMPSTTDSGSMPASSPVKGATLGSFKEGTSSVPKTGKYMLHKGEAVIPKARNSMYRKIYMNRMKNKDAIQK